MKDWKCTELLRMYRLQFLRASLNQWLWAKPNRWASSPGPLWWIIFTPLMRMFTTWAIKAKSDEHIVDLTEQVRIVSNGSKIVHVNVTANDLSKFGNTHAEVRQRKIPIKKGVINAIDKTLIITNMTSIGYIIRIVERVHNTFEGTRCLFSWKS